jgi:hypothetical protein
LEIGSSTAGTNPHQEGESDHLICFIFSKNKTKTRRINNNNNNNKNTTPTQKK